MDMATSKKIKKSKGKTFALNDFLQERPDTAPSPNTKSVPFNWADDVEDTYQSYEPKTPPPLVLPTAPKAARETSDYTSKIPLHPPFTAYLSNLPYDVTEREIAMIFKNLKIANMRIPKDERNHETKLKGFGYVEFENRESLINALAIRDRTLKNRYIKIEVATNTDVNKSRECINSAYKRGGRHDNYRDWRNEPNSYTKGRNCSRSASASHSNAWRDNNFRNNFDKEKLNGPRCGSIDRYGVHGNFKQREELIFKKNIHSEIKKPDGKGPSQEIPNRPKLLLAPRTRPIDTTPIIRNTFERSVDSSRPVSASIFGNARPVDTSARERQIEERLAQEKELCGRTEVKKTDSRKNKNIIFDRTFTPSKNAKGNVGIRSIKPTSMLKPNDSKIHQVKTDIDQIKLELGDRYINRRKNNTYTKTDKINKTDELVNKSTSVKGKLTKTQI